MAVKKDTKKDTKEDFIKNKVMLAFGVIQLGAKVVSAVALVAIAPVSYTHLTLPTMLWV